MKIKFILKESMWDIKEILDEEADPYPLNTWS